MHRSAEATNIDDTRPSPSCHHPSSVVVADRGAHRFPESDAGDRVVYGQRCRATGEPADQAVGGRGDAQRGSHRRGGRGRKGEQSLCVFSHDDA